MTSELTLKILTIDDSSEDRETYKRLLGHSSVQFEFIESEEGDQGLDILKQTPVDCVLLDFYLPDMDGLEVIKEMNTTESIKQIPVVFLTGQGSEEVAVQAMKNGASDYLVKSKLDSELLERSIQYAVSKADARMANLVKERMQGVLEMAGAMCHELAQPLQAISGYAELMQHSGLQTESQEKLLAKLTNQTIRLKGLIQRLMSLTHYETMDYPDGSKIIDITKSSDLENHS